MADDLKLFSERSLSNGNIWNYYENGSKIQTVKISRTFLGSFKQVSGLLKDVFLPKGYPDSVSKDYAAYQMWDTAQAFCSTISGTLAVQAVLQGVGVGSSEATPLAAAITWIMKDGVGMIGRIVFVWFKGSMFDSDCKKWRLFADVLNDMALLVELSIPLLLEHCSASTLLCMTTLMKSLVGAAGGATRAALVQHQATTGNVADVSAKDGSQETVVNLVASFVGVFILKMTLHTNALWLLMSILVIIHIYCNYRAVTALKMPTLNKQRLLLVLSNYLPTDQAPTVESINQQESVLLGCGLTCKQLTGFNILIGTSSRSAICSLSTATLQFLVRLCYGRGYLLVPDMSHHAIHVLLEETCTDELKAFFHAALVAVACHINDGKSKLSVLIPHDKHSAVSRLLNKMENMSDESNDPTDIPAPVVRAINEIIDKEYKHFAVRIERKNWKLELPMLQVGDWRVSYS